MSAPETRRETSGVPAWFPDHDIYSQVAVQESARRRLRTATPILSAGHLCPTAGHFQLSASSPRTR